MKFTKSEENHFKCPLRIRRTVVLFWEVTRMDKPKNIVFGDRFCSPWVLRYDDDCYNNNNSEIMNEAAVLAPQKEQCLDRDRSPQRYPRNANQQHQPTRKTRQCHSCNNVKRVCYQQHLHQNAAVGIVLVRLLFSFRCEDIVPGISTLFIIITAILSSATQQHHRRFSKPGQTPSPRIAQVLPQQWVSIVFRTNKFNK